MDVGINVPVLGLSCNAALRLEPDEAALLKAMLQESVSFDCSIICCVLCAELHFTCYCLPNI